MLIVLFTLLDTRTVSLNGVAFFPAQDLTPRDLEVLALALGKASDAPRDGELHIHPTAELGENGQPKVGKISNGEFVLPL